MFPEYVQKYISGMFFNSFCNTLYEKGLFLYEIMSFEVNEDKAQNL